MYENSLEDTAVNFNCKTCQDTSGRTSASYLFCPHWSIWSVYDLPNLFDLAQGFLFYLSAYDVARFPFPCIKLFSQDRASSTLGKSRVIWGGTSRAKLLSEGPFFCLKELSRQTFFYRRWTCLFSAPLSATVHKVQNPPEDDL